MGTVVTTSTVNARRRKRWMATGHTKQHEDAGHDGCSDEHISRDGASGNVSRHLDRGLSGGTEQHPARTLGRGLGEPDGVVEDRANPEGAAARDTSAGLAVESRRLRARRAARHARSHGWTPRRTLGPQPLDLGRVIPLDGAEQGHAGLRPQVADPRPHRDGERTAGEARTDAGKGRPAIVASTRRRRAATGSRADRTHKGRAGQAQPGQHSGADGTRPKGARREGRRRAGAARCRGPR